MANPQVKSRHPRATVHRVCLWLAIFLTGPVPLIRADDYRDAIRLSESGDILPLEQVLERAKTIQPGKVLEVEFGREYGVYVYELEILDADGRLWEVEFNAQTGEWLETELED